METKTINRFPGYELVFDDQLQPHNMYRDTDVGFGGYIYGEEGMYGNVALLDAASMHPSSIIAMNCFGEYTQHFKDILDARLYIKHGDFESAKKMLNGRLAPYLEDKSTAKDLAQALKIAINSVYGLTSAKFDNPFRDIRNKNNIVALRGALFMRTLEDEVKERGFTVVSIRTDSIKIADATPEIIKFVQEFGVKYGYTMEHECTYERMCLVNKSAYIAKYATESQCEKLYGYVPEDNKKHPGKWTATAKQFAVPYVFKTLFSKEPITIDDMRETFSVKSALYLDMNEKLPDVSEYEKEIGKLERRYETDKISEDVFWQECARLKELVAKGHDYRFVGRVGEFCPVKPGVGGGLLMREQNGRYYAATGTTGYRWLESETVMKKIGEMTTVIDDETGEEREIAKAVPIPGNEDIIDKSYYRKLVDDAVEAISKYGDFEWFVSDDPYIPKPKIEEFMNIPENADEDEGLPFN